MTSAATDDEFRAFVSRFQPGEEGLVLRKGKWWIAQRLAGHDFCKEILEPGTNENLPDGAVGIRTDDDFWIAAELPYRFKDLDCATLVSIAWPHIENPIIRPDSGDYWWTARYNDDLEVPGEPFEVWTHITYQDGYTQNERYDSYRDRSEADKRAHFILGSSSIGEGHTFTVIIKEWSNGVRSEIAKHPFTP